MFGKAIAHVRLSRGEEEFMSKRPAKTYFLRHLLLLGGGCVVLCGSGGPVSAETPRLEAGMVAGVSLLDRHDANGNELSEGQMFGARFATRLDKRSVMAAEIRHTSVRFQGVDAQSNHGDGWDGRLTLEYGPFSAKDPLSAVVGFGFLSSPGANARRDTTYTLIVGLAVSRTIGERWRTRLEIADRITPFESFSDKTQHSLQIQIGLTLQWPRTSCHCPVRPPAQ
jgi:hypothetical protein